MAQNNREFDIIIFGATGFTGQFVVELMATVLQNEIINWAIAGRSLEKLEQVLKKASKVTKIELNTIKIIISDVYKEESLQSMCRRTKILLNCCGPYGLYGPQVVRACIDSGTHHLDISGEPLYLETMQLLYNKIAAEKQLYIIGSCGWDSIPTDLGVQYLKHNFIGELHSVDTFITIETGAQGYQANYATWLSAINGFANIIELKKIRKELFTVVFTKKSFINKNGSKNRLFPFWSPIANRWCLEFPGSDRSVVQRTQQFRYERYDERPTHIQTYMTFNSLFTAILTLILSIVFATFSSFSFTRILLTKYPNIFSFGLFSRRGPTRQQIKDTKFEILIVGKGLSQPFCEIKESDDKTVVVRIRGLDPGYLTTSGCLVESALTILQESDKLPKPGGVFTPGSAFDGTDIHKRLVKHGLTFEFIDNY